MLSTDLRVAPLSYERVRLYEDGHRYVVGEGLTEREPPSFSAVMKSAGLSTNYGGVSQTVLDFASAVGTLTHEWIDEYLQGLDPHGDDRGLVSMAAEQRFESFLKWLKGHELVPFYNETPAYHPILRYCCTADFLGLLDGAAWVVDYKTTSKIARNVGYQTMAQKQCFNFFDGQDEDRVLVKVKRGALWIPKRGDAKMIRFSDDAFDEKTVESATHCWYAKEAA